MNTFLWIIQFILAIKFASVAFTHGLRPDEAKMQPGLRRHGRFTRPLLAVIAVLVLAGAVGLLLPAASSGAGWLAPWSAALLAVMELASIAFHLSCREKPNLLPGVILFLLAAVVAYARWALPPL